MTIPFNSRRFHRCARRSTVRESQPSVVTRQRRRRLSGSGRGFSLSALKAVNKFLGIECMTSLLSSNCKRKITQRVNICKIIIDKTLLTFVNSHEPRYSAIGYSPSPRAPAPRMLRRIPLADGDSPTRPALRPPVLPSTLQSLLAIFSHDDERISVAWTSS